MSEVSGLESRRKSLGLSRREVAELIGIKESKVWTLERSLGSETTFDYRRALEALDAYAATHPEGKPSKTTRRTRTTSDYRQAVKVALDGIAILAANDPDAGSRAELLKLHADVTAAAMKGGE